MYPSFPETIESECLDYNKEQPAKVANITETLYVTKRTITFDSVLNEFTTMTLDEELRPRAINAVEIELHQKLEEITTEPTTEIKQSRYLGESNTDVRRGVPESGRTSNY